jgi:hypothetical protein
MFANTHHQPATTQHNTSLGVNNGTWWHHDQKACYENLLIIPNHFLNQKPYYYYYLGRFNTKLYYFQKC